MQLGLLVVGQHQGVSWRWGLPVLVWEWHWFNTCSQQLYLWLYSKKLDNIC
jgi:hypothetical protein